MEEVEVSEVLKGILDTHPFLQREIDVKFSNPDIKYLQRKTGLSHKFVARCLRIFGEEVVLESLRRYATRRYQHTEEAQEAAFIYICRGVESAGKEEK
jgi:hypothetical protein